MKRIKALLLLLSANFAFAPASFAQQQDLSLEEKMFGGSELIVGGPPVTEPAELGEPEGEFLADEWVALMVEKWFFENMYWAASVNSFLLKDVPAHLNREIDHNAVGNMAIGAGSFASGAVAVAADAAVISFLAWYATDSAARVQTAAGLAPVYSGRRHWRLGNWRPVYDSHRLLDFIAGKITGTDINLTRARESAVNFGNQELYAKDIDDLRELISATDESYQGFSSELDEANKAFEADTENLRSLEVEVQAREKRLKELEVEISELEQNSPDSARLVEASEARTTINETIADLKANQTALSERLQELATRREDLSRTMAELAEQRAGYRSQLEDFEQLRQEARTSGSRARAAHYGGKFYRYVVRPLGTGILVIGGGLAALGIANGAFNEPVAVFTGYDQGTLIDELAGHLEQIDLEIAALWDLGLDPSQARAALNSMQ